TLGLYAAGQDEAALFAERTGIEGGTVFASNGPGPQEAAAGPFVQLRNATTFGIYFDTRQRGASALTKLHPLLQSERFAPDPGEPETRIAPWAGQYDTDTEVAISFDARLKRLVTATGSHASAHPTLDFFCRESFAHLYFVVVAFGTIPSDDLLLRDGPVGKPIVSAGFHASRFGRNFGVTSLATPSPF